MAFIMTTTNETTLAYLAGFIDGEGNIGIRKGARKACLNLAYWAEMRVGNTRIEPLQLLQSTFGGHMYLRDGRKYNWKDQWVWVAPQHDLIEILTSLVPYLVQ
mgnify:FL=1